MNLDIEKTYSAIREAAQERRFLTYGDIAAASGVPWSKARRLVPHQLGRLVEIAHERGWPLLSAIVVPKDRVETGDLEGGSLDGFLSAARSVGIEPDDTQAFVCDQQEKTFAWAQDAPAELGVDESLQVSPRGGGPRFIHYFGPVLDALREFGGAASPDKVYQWVRDHVSVPKEEIEGVNKGGQSKFENKVAWARFYLVKAGLIDGSKRGLWKLTSEGQETVLGYEEASALFRDIHSRFKTAEDEDDTPPDTVAAHELFDDPDRRFWFVGAVWDETEDQLDRFVSEGVWQNGYDEKFADHVNRMRPGDRIAVKSAFVKKLNLPFDVGGKPVSCMRIKAVGTITENTGDGKTVKVDWQELDPPRDWYFYTYRVTVVEADPDDELARRLILFAFAGGKQDYEFWIKRVPYFSRKYGGDAGPESTEELLEPDELETEEEAAAPSYTIQTIAAEGCFLPQAELEEILARVEAKKNLVLQGPPGTGKTWLAKRLAYALIGSKDRKVTRNRLRIVQFHPSLAYEDFVRGWRPAADGRLALVDGIFLETVQAAAAEPDRPYVLVIEEINRGNPAQIFGEVLTLLEDSKRNREDALELAYRREEAERVFIPPNLYVIGTMNIADRSLALVDLALRRRFAFIDLKPQLNGLWKSWCTERCGLTPEAVALIEQRMNALNQEIEEDRALGPQYRVGHSYVTPPEGRRIADAQKWFRDVAATEVIPLLAEYWFDAPDKVTAASRKLLDGL